MTLFRSLKWRMLTPALASLAIVTSMAMAPTGVAASSDDPIQTYQNVNTGNCIGDSRVGLRTWMCNGLDYQKWT